MTRLLLFLGLNLGALALGGMVIARPATDPWYQALDRAPWTPPGWVFGAAWTTIMLAFAVFMWRATDERQRDDARVVHALYAVQLVLNVGWNVVFFGWHLILVGLLVIVALTAIVGWFLAWGLRRTGAWGLLVLPYVAWLLVAASLNGYIWLHN